MFFQRLAQAFKDCRTSKTSEALEKAEEHVAQFASELWLEGIKGTPVPVIDFYADQFNSSESRLVFRGVLRGSRVFRVTIRPSLVDLVEVLVVGQIGAGERKALVEALNFVLVGEA